MDRSRIRSIPLGAIIALGLIGTGAGCALDEGIDYLVNHYHAGLIKASLICGGNPPV